ncbi:MAG: D-aminoacyl-tRNA deacylase [bacterium]
MRAVIQRVSKAEVMAADKRIGAITSGLVILIGIHKDDLLTNAAKLAHKIIHVRIFDDDAGRMNRSLLDVDGSALIISQFTLFGDCSKGRRPDYTCAAQAPAARRLYEAFIQQVKQQKINVASGVFGASMSLTLALDGPVTIILDTNQ